MNSDDIWSMIPTVTHPPHHTPVTNIIHTTVRCTLYLCVRLITKDYTYVSTDYGTVTNRAKNRRLTVLNLTSIRYNNLTHILFICEGIYYDLERRDKLNIYIRIYLLIIPSLKRVSLNTCSLFM